MLHRIGCGDSSMPMFSLYTRAILVSLLEKEVQVSLSQNYEKIEPSRMQAMIRYLQPYRTYNLLYPMACTSCQKSFAMHHRYSIVS